jgi:hypothetical protein
LDRCGDQNISFRVFTIGQRPARLNHRIVLTICCKGQRTKPVPTVLRNWDVRRYLGTDTETSSVKEETINTTETTPNWLRSCQTHQVRGHIGDRPGPVRPTSKHQ